MDYRIKNMLVFLIDFLYAMTDSHLPFNEIRLRGTYTAAAVVADRGAVPNESVKENKPFANQSEPAEN